MYGAYAYHVSGSGERLRGVMKHMKKSADNSGFSMVELIIVIAIMAVLVAVLVPQYLKYVHQSKVSTDVNNATSVAEAVNVAIADETVALNLPAEGVVVNVTASDLPNVNAFPVSKVDSSYSWTVQVEHTGIVQVKLGGYQIWPNPDDAVNGYRTNNR